MRTYRRVIAGTSQGLGGHQQSGEAKPVLGPGGPATDRKSLGWPLGDCTRWCEKAEPTRSGRLWAPTGRGDTQQVTKKPASPWRPVSQRGKLDQRQEEDVAGLDRFALLLLAGQPGQPCQPQLIMHPHQRVRLHRLLVIGHNKLCAPRPISRMPPLQKPSVSTPIRRRSTAPAP